ncbi:MAG: hypothetical protein AB7D36_06255 [Oscillospiraceae bacterium]
MTLWISAFAGALLLLGTFICNSYYKKTAAPVFRYLPVVLGVLAALCFFYCTSALLLIVGIE